MKLVYKVCDNKYKTIKDVILNYFHISNRLLTKLKSLNCIFLNSDNAFVNAKIDIGDIVCISFEYEEDNSNIIPKNMNLDIIFEDDYFLVINKISGIPVHPSILHYEDSLSNGVCFYFNQIGLKKKIRPVNRIDKDTSGIVIFAKNEYVQECLIKQMKNNVFKKEYIAIVENFFDNKKGCVKLPIGRKQGSIIERCISNNGDLSITNYEVLHEKIFNTIPISIIKCSLKTGRTHQIRVHMSYLGHPIIGDSLYNGNINFFNRQALHSYSVEFIHPISNEKLNIIAPIPNDMKNIIDF